MFLSICSLIPETIIGLSITAEADGKSPWFPGKLLHSEARQEGTHKNYKSSWWGQNSNGSPD